MKKEKASTSEDLATKVVKHYPLRGEIKSVTTPIVAASTFLLDNAEYGANLFTKEGRNTGWLYTRWGNPTTDVAARMISQLEHAASSMITASGMAAITTTLIALLNAGDHIIAPNSIYGGTHEFLSTIGGRLGYDVTFINPTDPTNYQKALQENTKVLYAESPANPVMKITDLSAVAKIAQDANCVSVVDSTFASPVNQQPLALGMDIVVHSATKYLGGHSDLVAGCISLNYQELHEKCWQTRKLLGGTISAFDSYLLIRGMKTLAVRMKKHNANAQAIAEFLEKHSKVEKVNYPGLPSHSDHELAKRQMTGFGGMVSFEVKGGIQEGQTFVESLKLCNLAVSLGGVETLVEHPATMTHSMVPRQEREKAGITGGLIRLSVGIESAHDLINDLDQALNREN